MALKDTWVDRVDGVDDASAEDINEVAHAVIDLEENQPGEIIVDSEMSDTSTNPVQNNVVKTYVEAAVSDATPNDFELIASGTTTEEVNSIIVSTDNDGNPFELCDMISVYFYSPAGGQTNTVTIELDGNIVYQASNAVKADAVAHSRVLCVYDGLMFETFGYSGAGTGGNANIYSRVKPANLSQDNAISEIKMYIYGGVRVLPVGFKYYICGRRVKNANT